MDMVSTQFHDRLAALEQENAMLRAHIQSCERSCAVLQAEIAAYRRDNQDRHSLEHRLLEATATVANTLLSIEDFDTAVNIALKILGEALETDRLAIADNVASQSGSSLPSWRLLYEWDSPGTLSQIAHPELAQGSWEGIEEWYERLSQGQSISRFIEDTPEPFRSVQAESGAKALHSVPIFVEGKYWGQLGFDDCYKAKYRSSAELSALKIAADCIGSAIQRNRTQQALLQAEQARSRSAAERSAELAKANEALRRCLDRLAGEPNLDSILHHILTEIVVLLDAKGLAVFHYDAAAHTLNLANTFNADAAAAPDVDAEELKSFTAPVPADITPYWQTLLQFRAPMILDANNPAHVHLFWPGTRQWHLRWNQPISVGVPMLVGDEILGFLGLTFEGNMTLTPEQLSLAQALTHQATLSIKLMRLAQEAKQAAIAREQERAAQQQATELSRANTLLRNSLSRLSTNPNLKDVLGHLLVELVRYAGASVGHIFIHDVVQDTLTLNVRCQDGQPFWTAAADEPALFRSPIALEHTPIFTYLCAQPRLAILNQDEFEGRLWSGVSQWFADKGYRGTCSCVLMVGDRPLGMLAMAFSHPVAFRSVEEELILALTQQIALVIQLTTLGELDKQTAVAKLNEIIAREQEKAALERATELAKANSALKHSLDRLAQESDLECFLGHVLREIAHQVQATAGHIFLLNVETNTLELCLEIQNGQLYRQAQPDEPILFQAAVPADITPIFQYLCEKRTLSSWNAGELDGMTWAGTLEWSEREGFTEAVCLALIVGDQPVGMLGLVFRDKSTLKPEEAELIHALAHQATLAIQLTRLAEEAKQVAIFEERNRMASEIHDTLAQVFTGISLQLEVAKPLVYQEPETVEQILAHISQLAETGLAEARRSVWALYPPAAEYADLAQMLYDSVEHMTRNTAITVEVNVQGHPCSLSPFIGMNLLRIGQESLTNSLKHAQAQRISIELTYELDRIWLTISDDGRGFTLPTHIDSLNGGFGLVGMYERCDRIGAQLSVLSQPGQGTQISVEAPLSQS